RGPPPATTDMLLEGVHFDLATTDLYSLGWKSAAVNLSDIAAMGGVPRYCLTGLGIPPALTVEDIGEFYRGVNACLKKFGTALVGGDTCRSKKGLVIAVTVLGEAGAKQVLSRSGARPGDRIFVTGTLGDSGAGLELLRIAGRHDPHPCPSPLEGEGKRERGLFQRGVRGKKPGSRSLIEKHLKPVPRVAEGRKLALSGAVSSMIDLSDGLSSDLAHICEESGVGAELHAGQVPLSKELRSTRSLKRPALEYALSGGEDYELLFTVRPEKLGKIKSLRINATEIGVVIRGRSIALIGEHGRKSPLRPSGYDHFRTVMRGERALR
ncbi:MAG: thiamine-phosphate kinase, partial [Nitrospirota bacterium]